MYCRASADTSAAMICMRGCVRASAAAGGTAVVNISSQAGGEGGRPRRALRKSMKEEDQKQSM